MKKATLKNGLICVSVPKDATEFHKSNHAVGFKSEKWKFDRDCNNWCYISFGLGGAQKIDILGTIDKEQCNFDFYQFCPEFSGMGGVECFNYFKSMIESETEFLLDNPKKQTRNEFGGELKHYQAYLKIYKHAQSRVVEKLLILKQIQ